MPCRLPATRTVRTLSLSRNPGNLLLLEKASQCFRVVVIVIVTIRAQAKYEQQLCIPSHSNELFSFLTYSSSPDSTYRQLDNNVVTLTSIDRGIAH
jgi:hypothetical protein